MARERRKSDMPPAELPMTPMIDVVFQLLIYFIVTLKPIDVLANLEVMKPESDKSIQQNMVQLVQINVLANAYGLNDNELSYEQLETYMVRISDDKEQTIMIKCSRDAPHERLIKVLDLCARLQLKNLTLVSTN